ncbi:hypothetical protein ACOQFB_08845 [Anaeromyxobacter sp. Red801]|uniref:hypothetical protein n=1 Tax=Anaeromyxobacter sp. Red801 TaxID=3411632 RepID=UPI003BA06607
MPAGTILERWRTSRRQARFRILTEWREELNGFERDLLVPEVRSRLELMLKYFEKLVADCEEQRGSAEWAALVDSLLNPPGSDPRGHRRASAEMYFGALIPQLQSNYIDPIKAVLPQLDRIETFKTLGAALNEVNLICESVTGVHELLLKFKMRGIAIVRDIATGEAVVQPPRELHLIMLPFEQILGQLVMLASSTADSLKSWRNGEAQAKPKFLELENARTSLANNTRVLWVNIATVLVAIALSAFFLVAGDPFALAKTNRVLKSDLAAAQAEQNRLASELATVRAAQSLQLTPSATPSAADPKP